MSNQLKTYAKTRVSDIDSYRHVTTITYEQFALEARHVYLNNFGFSIEKMLEEGIKLKPVRYKIVFYNQQKAFVDIIIETNCYSTKNSELYFNHAIKQPDGVLVCTIETLQDLIKDEKKIKLNKIEEKNDFEFREFPVFQKGNCERFPLQYTLRNFELDQFMEYSPIIYWKILEEARWDLGAQIQMPMEVLHEKDFAFYILELDTAIFKTVPPREPITIYTWIEKTSRTRSYFRQDICSDRTRDLILSNGATAISVSLKKSKPTRLPDFWHESIKKVLEVKGITFI